MYCFHRFARRTILLSLAAALTAAAATGAIARDWPLAHATSGNNAVLDIPAQIADPAGASAWTSPDLQFFDRAPAVISAPYVYLAGRPTGGPADGVALHALHAETGQPVWETAPLDTPPFDSYTAAAVVREESAVYYASGATVYRFDALTGAQVWATTLGPDNTAPDVAGVSIINSSPAPGGDLLFIETYGGFTPEIKQLVALDRTTGEVVWWVNDHGNGTGTPIYVEAAPARVYSVGPDQLRCYDAATGARLWSSDEDVPTTWSLAPWTIFASPTLADGRVYVVGADPSYMATTTTLVCADAETGALLWRAEAPATDCPPLVLNGRVYVYGGTAPTLLAAYDAATGTPVFNVVVAPLSYVFRDYMAATRDAIYLTADSSLVTIDPADGSVLGSRSGNFGGPVSLDGLGGVYAHESTWGGPSVLWGLGQTVPVALDGFIIE